jgi:hypothetical protein
MREEYESYFLKYLYELLNLEIIEAQLLKEGIKPIIKNELSNFFWIENSVDIDALTTQQKNDFQMYTSQLNNYNMQYLNRLLEETYKNVLLSKSGGAYGPSINRYSAPPGSIVLGFYYQKFDDNNKTMAEIISREMFINTILNKIQLNAKEKFGLNVSIMKYDRIIQGKKIVKHLRDSNS